MQIGYLLLITHEGQMCEAANHRPRHIQPLQTMQSIRHLTYQTLPQNRCMNTTRKRTTDIRYQDVIGINSREEKGIHQHLLH